MPIQAASKIFIPLSFCCCVPLLYHGNSLLKKKSAGTVLTSPPLNPSNVMAATPPPAPPITLHDVSVITEEANSKCFALIPMPESTTLAWPFKTLALPEAKTVSPVATQPLNKPNTSNTLQARVSKPFQHTGYNRITLVFKVAIFSLSLLYFAAGFIFPATLREVQLRKDLTISGAVDTTYSNLSHAGFGPEYFQYDKKSPFPPKKPASARLKRVEATDQSFQKNLNTRVFFFPQNAPALITHSVDNDTSSFAFPNCPQIHQLDELPIFANITRQKEETVPLGYFPKKDLKTHYGTCEKKETFTNVTRKFQERNLQSYIPKIDLKATYGICERKQVFTNITQEFKATGSLCYLPNSDPETFYQTCEPKQFFSNISEQESSQNFYPYFLPKIDREPLYGTCDLHTISYDGNRHWDTGCLTDTIDNDFYKKLAPYLFPSAEGKPPLLTQADGKPIDIRIGDHLVPLRFWNSKPFEKESFFLPADLLRKVSELFLNLKYDGKQVSLEIQPKDTQGVLQDPLSKILQEMENRELLDEIYPFRCWSPAKLPWYYQSAFRWTVYIKRIKEAYIGSPEKSLPCWMTFLC